MKHTQGKKVWAIYHGKKIETADFFIDSGCCSDETNAMAIYETKREAIMMLGTYSGHTTIPIIITPIKPKKK